MIPLKLMVAVAGITVLGSIGSAAQSGSDAGQTPPSTPNSDSTLGTADLNQSGLQSGGRSTAVTDRYLTTVKTELTGKVDSKNAVVGQEVSARTLETAKLADGTTLPKGSKLAGRVTQVQPMANGGGRSLLAISFDHAELKGGKTMEVRSVMQMVAPPAPISMTNNAMEAMPGGPIIGAPPVGSRGGRGSGTGTDAGGARSSGRNVGSAAGPVTAGGLEPVMPAEGGVVTSAGETVSQAPRATQLPGVVLSTAGTAYTSGTLMGAGRNVTLESGTRITLGVIAR
jgi:hypothetical protein